MNNIYKNGTYTVMLDNYGTKKYIGEEFIADFPDSLDLKITEQCQHKCPFCHENSTKKGKHGDLQTLIKKLKGLPSGVELAVGGGNALLHPDLQEFLKKLKGHFKVALTVNWKDTKDPESKTLIQLLENKKLITSLGISIADTKLKELKEAESEVGFFREISPVSIPTVFHVIPGITSRQVFKHILWESTSYSKILILGFKQFGKAIDKDLPVEEFKEWGKIISDFYTKGGIFIKSRKTLAFDNLALEQLRVKEIFPEHFWNEHYMGEEFTHSMYVDACKGEFGPTSRSPFSERSSWEGQTVIEYFKKFHKS